MRRILRALVFKKRASANKTEKPAWHASDLLFISAYGEEAHREITLAHFVENEDYGNLAELRVLGWDDDDTQLKYDHIAQTLREKLRWRDEFADDPDLWRSRWREAFIVRHQHVIKTSKELALAMAQIAKRIRGRVRSVLRLEDGFGELRKLQRGFKAALIHDLTDDDFADMIAQTVTYGLFSVAVRRTFPGEGTAVTRENMPELILTSPFLKEMMEVFVGVKSRKGKIDFDELGIADLEDMLCSPTTHMEHVLRDFGNRTRQEDPVIHFYELFLTEYDKQRKIQRGVFYTPQPVVSYIVRSVHELLQTEFGLEDGLADTTTWGEMIKRNPKIKLPPLTDELGEKRTISPDEPFVVILDIAAGTATFGVEVIDVIHKTMVAKWRKNCRAGASPADIEKEISRLWNDYVPKHLLPRLYGYELMMAPYAIAHMKIGLKLTETGYKFRSEERARIYLTNTLEPWQKQPTLPDFEALAHEAAAVNEIKRCKRFTVLIGNPPYSKSSQNQGDWIEAIMEAYKTTVRNAETQIQALSDDYAKFLRFGHYTLETSKAGILGYITNNSFLDGPLFRDMRRSMLGFFQQLRVLNLHGDSRKQFAPPEGKADENVFDIQQGVAITVLSRKKLPEPKADLGYRELWGTRQERYQALEKASVVQGGFGELHPSPPFHLFIPVSKDLEAEFHLGVHLYDVFGTGNQDADNHESYGAGFITQQDKFAVGFSPEEIVENVQTFLDPTHSREVLWERFEFCSTNQWDFARAKRELKNLKMRPHVKRCLYRPFDYRFTVFDRNICTIVRKRITSQFDEPNLGLLTTRRVTRLPYNNVFVSNCYAEYKIASHDRNTIVFPLWIRAEGESDSSQLFDNHRRLNLNPAFLAQLVIRLGLSGKRDRVLPGGLTPEDIFHYAYAVFHSPGYRTRYAEFLKIDFPRLPLTSNLKLFRALAALGGDLVALHLLESPKLDKPITQFIGDSKQEIEKVTYAGKTVWIDKAQATGFKVVPDNVWNFHIGGYQVCQKWLKDRKGRTLSKDDIAHYHKIVIALSETIRLMAKIDQVIDNYGGWPIK
jgi:predicted helicase